MPDNIFPDITNSQFDFRYNQLKILASDVKSRLFNQGQVTSSVGSPETGDTDPGVGTGNCAPCNCRFFNFFNAISLPESMSEAWVSGDMAAPDASANLSTLTEISISKYIIYPSNPGYTAWLTAGLKTGSQLTIALQGSAGVYGIFQINGVMEMGDYFIVEITPIYAIAHALVSGEDFVICWDNVPAGENPPPDSCKRYVNVGREASTGVSYIDCDGNEVLGVSIDPWDQFCALEITNYGVCGALVLGGECIECGPCCAPTVNSVSVN